MLLIIYLTFFFCHHRFGTWWCPTHHLRREFPNSGEILVSKGRIPKQTSEEWVCCGSLNNAPVSGKLKGDGGGGGGAWEDPKQMWDIPSIFHPHHWTSYCEQLHLWPVCTDSVYLRGNKSVMQNEGLYLTWPMFLPHRGNLISAQSLPLPSFRCNIDRCTCIISSAWRPYWKTKAKTKNTKFSFFNTLIPVTGNYMQK